MQDYDAQDHGTGVGRHKEDGRDVVMLAENQHHKKDKEHDHERGSHTDGDDKHDDDENDKHDQDNDDDDGAEDDGNNHALVTILKECDSVKDDEGDNNQDNADGDSNGHLSIQPSL